MTDGHTRPGAARPGAARSGAARSGAARSGEARWRAGFDIGGTFTDFVLFDAVTRSVTLHKCLTTPDDPSRAALQGLQAILDKRGLAHADIGALVHGTTLVTNAIIERKGARVGLIASAGFRDSLEMGTGQRYDIYDLFAGFPEPLVSRDRRLEVPERLDVRGRVVQPLDEAAVLERARTLVGAGCEAIAIAFLHAHVNPVHERRAAAIVRAAFPDVSVSISSDVAPEIGEYRRTVTTCANACVQPLMDRYLTRLEQSLRASGFAGDLRLMHSAGGLLSLETARAHPIRLLESGPAGGGLATVLFGAAAGKKDVISFDMGGTTAKACMIGDGKLAIAPELEAARVNRFARGSGLPIRTPVIEMIEIGAGGGSIAALDAVGLLRVGPRSAGADPGPACYGKGGVEPTVTDASLVLGHYDPGFFLGGRMALDMAAARTALARVAGPLGLEVEAAALGIHRIVVENMAAAARVHLVERGRDPRDYAMVGFGGAGPAHAVDVARVLGIREVIVPPASGAASALGFLSAPLSFETVRSHRTELQPGFDAGAINAVLSQLEGEGRAHLTGAGVAPDDIRIERLADMRLVGQMHDIAVPLPAADITRHTLGDIQAAFNTCYTARYAQPFEGARTEVVNLRVRATGPTPDLSLSGAVGGGDPANRQKGTRTVRFEAGNRVAAVYDRHALVPGDRIAGPAIVEEHEATTVLGPGDSLYVDDSLNLRIAVAAAAIATRPPAATDHAAAMARIQDDPIGLEIMWSRLVNVVEEMWLTVCRTAFSLVISEAQDFACELLDRDGETLAHSPRAMPVFNLTLPRAVQALLRAFPADTLRPGDVLITNDPWLCAGHLFDIAIVTPAFRNGRLVGLLGTVGHVSDIGGTRNFLAAREVYEEGFQIPPMKLYDGGVPNATLIQLLRLNVRNSDQVWGDIQSLVTANHLGAKRLAAFMDAFGMDDLRPLAAVVQTLSETAMRDAIRALPDGTWRSEVSSAPLGEPVTCPVAVTVRGDSMTIDFAGAPAQLPQGGLNCTLNYTAAHATYPLKCMLTPTVRGNAGCYRPFEVVAPAGSVLNCTYPAAVNLRTRTGWYIAPNIFKALAGIVPHRVQASSGLATATGIYGQDAGGRFYADLLFCGGGQGASAHADGIPALLWPTSAASTAIELLEARVPILVEEKTCLPDSGGSGQFRGGPGQRVIFRKRDDDGLTTLVSVCPEGVLNPVPGLFGGAAGRPARGRVLDSDGNLLRDCGTGALVELTGTGQRVELILAGGAGYGRPEDRDPAAHARDRVLGFVTEPARPATNRAANTNRQATPAPVPA